MLPILANTPSDTAENADRLTCIPRNPRVNDVLSSVLTVESLAIAVATQGSEKPSQAFGSYCGRRRRTVRLILEPVGFQIAERESFNPFLIADFRQHSID